MRRVVVTGMGIWSCIGQDLQAVTESLKKGRSGIVFDTQRVEYGLQSGLIGNVPHPNLRPLLPRYYRSFMPEDTMFAYMASVQALNQAQLSRAFCEENVVGVLFGNDGNTSDFESILIMDKYHDAKMIEPYVWIKSGSSNVSFVLSEIFHLTGMCASVGAACASSSHAIGIANLCIKQGMQDFMLVGGSCEVRKEGAAVADAIGALSLSKRIPQTVSRPFDKDRDGMVPSGGAAALVLEEYEHAKARGANILAEIAGYGISSNGIEEISMPSADAEYIAMKNALDDAGLQPSDIDYVNAHGTSTPIGDIEEAKALTRLFGSKPFVSSTKSMTGHENWMAGASEAVYSILMMQNGFVAPNINLDNVIDEAKDLNIVRETIYTPVNIVLSNSSGMGGTNSALMFKKI